MGVFLGGFVFVFLLFFWRGRGVCLFFVVCLGVFLCFFVCFLFFFFGGGGVVGCFLSGCVFMYVFFSSFVFFVFVIYFFM